MFVERIAGLLIVIGSLMFMLAASPIGGKVYGESSVARQMEIINGNRQGWVTSQVLFIVASIITVVGYWVFVAHLRQNPYQSLVSVASVLFTIGTVIWVIHLFHRAVDPEPVLSGEKRVTSRFIGLLIYAMLTEAALFLNGIAFLQIGYPAWLGYATLLFAAILLIQLFAFRGRFIPLLFYIPMLLAGAVFLF